MRIVFITSLPGDGALGCGEAVAGLRGGLVALGHEVVTLRPQGAPRGSVLLHRLFFNLAVSRALAAVAADLVVGVGLDGFLWARGRRTVPYVVWLRELVADRAAGEPSSRPRLALQARMEGSNARRANGVVVPNRHARDAVIRQYRVAPERLRIVPEGIDLARWRATRPAAGEGATLLSVASRLGRAVVAELLDAVVSVRRAIPTVRAVVLCDRAEQEAVVGLATRRGLDASVTVRVVDTEEELVACVHAAEVVCLPSAETSMVRLALAAMASGVPVVATTAGSVSDAVPTAAGVFVPPGNVEALAEALIALFTSPERRRQLSEAGRQAAAAYDWPLVARRFLEELERPAR